MNSLGNIEHGSVYKVVNEQSVNICGLCYEGVNFTFGNVCFSVDSPDLTGLSTRVETVCKHTFHKYCLNTWLQFTKACPKCNDNFQKEKDVLVVSGIPNEVIIQVFSYLRPEELAKAAQVCREWRILTSDNLLWSGIEKRLSSLYPLHSSISIIDASIWKKHVDLERYKLHVEDVTICHVKEGQSPGKRKSLIPILQALKVMEKIGPLVEGNAGMTLLTIPKGLTFNKLVEMTGFPLRGNAFDCIDYDVKRNIGDVPVEKTYRILITNSILEESRGESAAFQQELAGKIGCEIPKVLEASTLAILTDMVFSKRLFPGGVKTTYTLCREKMDCITGNRTLSVGNFSRPGLNVWVDIGLREYFGIGVVWKLPAAGT